MVTRPREQAGKKSHGTVGRSPLKMAQRGQVSPPVTQRTGTPPTQGGTGAVPWSWEDKVEGRVVTVEQQRGQLSCLLHV